MAITIYEQFESRMVTTGLNPSAELRYKIFGTNDDLSARVTLEAGSPVAFDVYEDASVVLYRESAAVEPLGDELWEGVVRYGVSLPTDSESFSFDTSGGSQHITQSLETIARYAPAGQTAADCKGAIGVTPNGVEGVDITVPVYSFSATKYVPHSVIVGGYKAVLFSLTGKVNDDTFEGLEAGECLFLGASGSRRGGGDWEINFRFAASQNVEGITIGDIEDIDKKGFEYLWVRYEDVEDTTAKALVKRPIAVYIEKVYEEGDFDGLAY